MTGRASTNHSQANQTRLSWHKATGQWNWINAFIAICGVVAGIVALWAAIKGLMLQIWTSRKDFYELCLEQQVRQYPRHCQLTQRTNFDQVGTKKHLNSMRSYVAKHNPTASQQIPLTSPMAARISSFLSILHHYLQARSQLLACGFYCRGPYPIKFWHTHVCPFDEGD